MNMIAWSTGNQRFTFRVAGVCLLDGHVLLQTSETIDFWILPGGRCEFGETTIDSLRREMREELEADVDIVRLIWTIENFFERDGIHVHELSLCYEMTLPEDSPLAPVGAEFTTIDAGTSISFKWFPLGELSSLHLLPVFLRSNLQQLPVFPSHLINDERH